MFIISNPKYVILIFTNLICVYDNIKTMSPEIIPEPITDAHLEPVPTVRKHLFLSLPFCGGKSHPCVMHGSLVFHARTPTGLGNSLDPG